MTLMGVVIISVPVWVIVVNNLVLLVFKRCQGESRDLRSIWKHLPHPERLPQNNVEPLAPSFIISPTLSLFTQIFIYVDIQVDCCKGCESSFFSFWPCVCVYTYFFSLAMFWSQVVVYFTHRPPFLWNLFSVIAHLFSACSVVLITSLIVYKTVKKCKNHWWEAVWQGLYFVF